MKRYARFVGMGALVAAVEEFLTVIVLRGDVVGFLLAVILLFPTFLTIGYFASRAVDRLAWTPLRRELVYLIGMGGLGLMIEWFLIGLAPWREPDANPLLLAIFQFGMFSFWASVAYLPRLFAAPHTAGLRGQIIRFLIGYAAIVYFVAFTSPPEIKFLALIALILFGFIFLNLFYLRYFRFLADRRIVFTGSPTNLP